MNISDQIKAEIAARQKAGVSLYSVAKGAGISYPALHRFMAGQRDIYLGTACHLADFLGLELQPKGPRGKGMGGKRR